MKGRNVKRTVAAVMLSLFIILIVIIGANILHRNSKMQFVKDLGVGINIGNALDSHGLREYHPEASDLEYETYWGNPEITEELFICIKEAGFSTVRIPITWQDHMTSDGTINEEWMERVQEVVDMALAQELYVIINTHHEEWLDLQPEKEEEIIMRYRSVWTQIAERFQTYDSGLLFEGMNEPRLRNSDYEWTEGTKELREMINRLNAVFVETVRKSGGENESRYLLISPYASNHLEDVMKELEVPRGNTIVSIHMYAPYTFCQDEDGMYTWDMNDEEVIGYMTEIQTYFANMNSFFVKKGVPVMVTEFGCKDKQNTAERVAWVQFYKEQADKYGIPCIWWDNGSNYQIMDRENYSWVYPQIKDELVR